MTCLPCAPLPNAHPFETGKLESYLTFDKHFPVILLAIRQRTLDLNHLIRGKKSPKEYLIKYAQNDQQ